jgi:uncharacterized membrane protein YqaE (UPF0057 family)
MSKDNILITIAIIILFITMFIDWNIYSWLILVGIILFLLGWYFKKK